MEKSKNIFKEHRDIDIEYIEKIALQYCQDTLEGIPTITQITIVYDLLAGIFKKMGKNINKESLEEIAKDIFKKLIKEIKE